MPLSLGNIILLKEKGRMRESIPRQADKKFGFPKEEKGVWGSQGEKDKYFFLYYFVLVNITMCLAQGHVSP